MNTEPPFTCWVSARLITEAMMGPTHGVQTSPRLRPTTSPLQKPAKRAAPAAPPAPARATGAPLPEPPLLAIRLVRSSNPFRSRGTSITIPNRAINTTATTRSASAGMPSARTIAARVSVKTVKLTTKPASTPKGRAFPPPMLPESTMGSTGRMHGERIVITPETKANASSTSMSFLPYERTMWLRMPSTPSPPPVQIAFCIPAASI